MKRFFVLALLCLVATLSAQMTGAQSRPRRVGQTLPSQPQSRSQPPQTPAESSPPAQTGRPPVLRGGNGSQSEQQPSSTSPQNAGPEEVSEGDIIRVNTTLVSIPVSVMDRNGRYIPDLRKEDFRIWEDGAEQQVAYFASTEKPFTVALMIDTSGSTRFKLEEMQEAAISFVNQLRSDDRVLVMSFDDKIRFLTPQPTNDRNALRYAIRETRPGSGTRLYDAVDKVINEHLNHVEGRKAIVLFTDGVDTTSRKARYEDNVRDAEELDALIYPIEFDTYSDMSVWGPGGGQSGGNVIDILGAILGGGNSRGNGGGYPGSGRGRGGRGGGPGGGGAGDSREEYERGDRYLHDLARVTGARLYNADQNLDVAFRSVAEELRRQYSLGYYPKRTPQPGERRSIKVRVDRPELAVRARDSYVFQPGANSTAQGGTNSQPKPPVLKKDLSGTF